ncbi:MAG TPA: caspase family protein [Thermoanaerobaculia bacterium]|nr:caspase family protein [Thermoanaerobaculia bacterium]
MRRLGLCAGIACALLSIHCPAIAGDLAFTPSPELSAGIFIGVEQFSYDFSLADVRFATNDAVDLAYSLSIERRLLEPKRVLLLLAGEPGPAAQARLAALTSAGATRLEATQAYIYSLVKQQAESVREGGVLVVFIATHGFAEGPEHLLMAGDSILDFRTGITTEKLLLAMQSELGGQRLLLIDACREELKKPSHRGSRAGEKPDRRSAMRNELLNTMAARGYTVFSAASPGGFAYPEGVANLDGNGYFTKSIVDGLECGVLRAKGRAVSWLALSTSVTAEVAARTKGQQQPDLRVGGGFRDFQLPACGASAPPRPVSPSLSPEVLQTIREARNLAATGSAENVEKSFRIYRQVFEELPPATLATLNQALVARAQQLEPDSRADAGVRLYEQLLEPLLALADKPHQQERFP